MSIKPLSTKEERARALRRTKRALRTANELLAQAERFLHDLPDAQCPTALLESIRRFNHAQGTTP